MKFCRLVAGVALCFPLIGCGEPESTVDIRFPGGSVTIDPEAGVRIESGEELVEVKPDGRTQITTSGSQVNIDAGEGVEVRGGPAEVTVTPN